MIDLHLLNRHRQPHLEIKLYGSIGNSFSGVFAFLSPVKGPRTIMRVLATCDHGWDHVSLSLNKKRTPTWEEMDCVKRMFFAPSEVVMQLHVSDEEHVSYHDYALHLWRPHDVVGKIPLPPYWMVGPKKGQSIDDAMEDAAKELSDGR